MPNTKNPRHGSLQYWPRKRAKRQTPRVRAWANISEAKPLGFPGYKVGMTHVIITDNKPNSQTKGEEISLPATIIECPPIKIASIVFYKNIINGSRVISAIPSLKLDKEIKRKITITKNAKNKIDDIKDYDDVRILVYTQPKLTTIGKKKPELFEISLGGKKEEKLAWIKENLNKEIKVQDVLKSGQLVDSHAVTKGKGIQGQVKRHGISLKSHKSQKSRRKAVLASEGDAKVQYWAHQAGQMGYHLRMQHNLWLISVGENPEDINKKSGYHRYGVIKNPYLLVKGSVQGSSKRLIILTQPIRANRKKQVEAPTIQEIVK